MTTPDTGSNYGLPDFFKVTETATDNIRVRLILNMHEPYGENQSNDVDDIKIREFILGSFYINIFAVIADGFDCTLYPGTSDIEYFEGNPKEITAKYRSLLTKFREIK